MAMQPTNEGIWDSIKNKASMVGNAALAQVGNSKAAGKLRTKQVSTSLYTGYQKSQGMGGGGHTPFAMKRFLDLSAVTSEQFNDRWAGYFGEYVKMTPEERSNFVKNYNFAKDEDLVIKGEPPEAKANPTTTKQDVEKGPTTAISLDPSTFKSNLEAYKSLPQEVVGDVVRHIRSNRWDKLSSEGDYEWEQRPDGSFICAKNDQQMKLVRDIFNSGSTPKILMQRFYDAGVLATADSFVKMAASKYPGDARNIMRDALMTSVLRIGFNYHSSINRYVLCVPELAMGYIKVANGTKIQVKEADEEQKKERKDLTDQELRDFFTLFTQSAYYSGYLQESAEEIANEILQETQEFLEKLIDEDTTAADIAPVPQELFKTTIRRK